jgi:hypothetical protein
MHDVMYSLQSPPAWQLGALLLGGFATFWIGMRVFNRYSRDIGEIL